MIRILAFLLIFSVGPVAFGVQCDNYELPAGMDLDHAFLDLCVTITIKRYIPETQVYEIEKWDDPTVVPIFTSRKHLFESISELLSEAVVEADPGSLVGKQLYIDKRPLILLEDDEIAARRPGVSHHRKK